MASPQSVGHDWVFKPDHQFKVAPRQDAWYCRNCGKYISHRDGLNPKPEQNIWVNIRPFEGASVRMTCEEYIAWQVLNQ